MLCVRSSSNMPVMLMALALLLLILFSCINDLKQTNQILVRASRSGIYIDNGVDQTIMHRLLDEDEKIDASHDILEFLGLMERPPRKKRNDLSLRKSAPQFLLDVYNRIKEEEDNNDDDDYTIPKSRRRKRDINHNNNNNNNNNSNNKNDNDDNDHYDDDYNDDDNFITDLDKRAIDQSDTIITFLHKYHHVDEIRMRHNHGRRLWFDVSDVSNDNYLMMAELRIYQNPLYTKRSVIHEMFTITVYNIIPKLTATATPTTPTTTQTSITAFHNAHNTHNDEGNKINDVANDEVRVDADPHHNHLMDDYELKILSSVNTTINYQGWLELNVTEGLNVWLMRTQPNLGLYVSAHVINHPEQELKLNDIGLIYTKHIMQQQQQRKQQHNHQQQQQHQHQQHHQEHQQQQQPQQQNDIDEYQPFLIGFFRGPELIKATKRRSRKKRNVHTRRRKKSEIINPLFENRSDSVRSCQMQTLYINFKDLDWHDWIIAPDGYGAFYCSGECNFPLNAHMNATNHAIVQTLVHLLEPKKVPKPCCAPTRLGALPVLYHLNEENVNLKKYKNMIVKSCGCH